MMKNKILSDTDVFQEPGVKQMTWNGSGNAMNKAITCAEIMKRKIKVNILSFS
jgi:DNA-binding protein